jgi:transcriptional regulator NrdR family protein
MQCPVCYSEMDAVDSFVVEDNYIEAERSCPNCSVKYYGILYPVKPIQAIGGGHESSDN